MLKIAYDHIEPALHERRCSIYRSLPLGFGNHQPVISHLTDCS